MRIIGGAFGGRKFYPPADKWPTRPTTDFAKEALFNILENEIDFESTIMLDLFGGTGNHCFEALSRGCQHTTYVDKYGPCLRFVKDLSEELGVAGQFTAKRFDVAKYIAGCSDSYDYIFAGPPYPLPWLNQIPSLLFESTLLKEDGMFVLEHNPNHDFSGFKYFDRQKKYGSTLFSFFKW